MLNTTSPLSVRHSTRNTSWAVFPGADSALTETRNVWPGRRIPSHRGLLSQTSWVHYCHVCDAPQLMIPKDGVARCPDCGNVDPPAILRPLFVVTGASGSGKSTVFPLVVDRLAGHCIVFDGDWLIDPLSQATPDGRVDWPAFRDTWLHVAHGVAQNGVATLLFAPFFPEQLDELPGRTWIGDVHYLVLDCSDQERLRRIEARPPWRNRDIEPEQTDFAHWLRTNLAPVLDTSILSPAEVADGIAVWVRTHTTTEG